MQANESVHRNYLNKTLQGSGVAISELPMKVGPTLRAMIAEGVAVTYNKGRVQWVKRA